MIYLGRVYEPLNSLMSTLCTNFCAGILGGSLAIDVRDSRAFLRNLLAEKPTNMSWNLAWHRTNSVIGTIKLPNKPIPQANFSGEVVRVPTIFRKLNIQY